MDAREQAPVGRVGRWGGGETALSSRYGFAARPIGMRGGLFINRVGMSHAAAVLVAGALTLAAATAAPAMAPLALWALATVAIAWIVWLQHMVRRILHRVSGAAAENAADPAQAADAGMARIERQLDSLRHRTAEIHPVSGLPVREALIRQIEAEGHGLLGVIAFKDFDRLSAFDPAMADRLVAIGSGRLRAMMPSCRFLAHIDRGHVGIWCDAGVGEAAAWAELDAVSYALGNEIAEGGTRIIPQVAFRLSAFDPRSSGAPAAFVARTLACFALPEGGSAQVSSSPQEEGRVARERFALEQDLRQAIDRRELHLAYQPLVDAARGRVAGAEALLRWTHPVRGTIPPAQFVPIFEAIGLAGEIGSWVLNTAVREAQRWDTVGIADLRVAVNVSGLQLRGDDLPRLVERALNHHGVRASRLEIELTESVATNDTAHCRTIFEALRALGVKLAVDDFGTGYSGFSSLRTLAFDKIKIDREFVTDVHRRRDSQAICRSIIALGCGLGIDVLAEGVERWEEYDWLRQQGCRHFQGYYFGRPMDGAAFTAFVRDKAALSRLLAPDERIERLTA